MRPIPWLLPALLCASSFAQGKPPATAPTADDARRMTEAESRLEKGDYRGAEVQLKQLANALPQDAQIQFDLGFASEHNGEDETAAKAYTDAITADPHLPEPHLALGLLHAREGKSDAARTDLKAVVALNTASPQLRARALRALARLDEVSAPDTARDELLQANQLNGEASDDAELAAGIAAHSGDVPDAEAAYRRVLLQHPGDVNATVGLAALLQHQGKLAEADALLTPALSEHSDDPVLTTEAAAIYAAEEKNPDAIALLTHLRETDPKAAADPAVTRMLAHLELVSGDAASAEPLYRGLAVTHPNDPTLLDDFGSVLVREQKFAEAEAVLEKAVSLRIAFGDDASWGDAEGHLAFAASRNHQPEVALQALQQRATVLPNSPASLFLQATSEDTLHQYKKARESYKAFLAMSNGKLPDEEFEARHRLVALEHEH